LLESDAIEIYRKQLFKQATLVTPNLDEVQALLGRAVLSVAEMREAGRELADHFGTAFLLKGGHLRENVATDLLFAGGKVSQFSSPFLRGIATHGTGCTYAAAITAGFARGLQ